MRAVADGGRLRGRDLAYDPTGPLDQLVLARRAAGDAQAGEVVVPPAEQVPDALADALDDDDDGAGRVVWARPDGAHLPVPVWLPRACLPPLVAGDGDAVRRRFPELVAGLRGVGILSSPTVGDAAAGRRQPTAAASGYAAVAGLLSTPALAVLRRRYRRLGRLGAAWTGPDRAPRHELVDEPAARAYQRLARPLVERLVGTAVDLGDAVVAFDEPGAVADAACAAKPGDVCLDVAIDFESAPTEPACWPIYLVCREKVVESTLAPGDALLYFRGRYASMRLPLPPRSASCSIRFHYAIRRPV